MNLLLIKQHYSITQSKSLLPAIMMLFMSSFLIAQNSSITGQILTDKGDVAEFVNVLLLNSVDSGLVKMDLSKEDGSYHFNKLKAGKYLIKVNGLGYNDQFSEHFTVDDGKEKVVPLINIEQMATTLDEIEVVARKPLLEQRAGKLVVNVDQNITGQGGSVTDLLKKVPGLVVVNNKVSMAGRQGVTILIDGRPTKYMDIQSLLNEMPADNISKIEVITQPGAAYDAEGSGGVINIILKKNALYGTNGNVTIGGGYGELPKYRIGGRLNHRSGPWNLSVAAGFNHRSWVERLDLDRILPDRTYIQKNYEPARPNSSYLNLGVDYNINDQHRVGISTNVYRSVRDQKNINETIIMSAEGVELDRFTTSNTQDRFWRSLTADAFYRWEIDTSGQELSIEANVADYRRRVTSSLITPDSDYENRVNKQPADTKIYGAQLDYKLPLATNWQLQAGAKISATRLNNEQDAKIFRNDEWINDIAISNTFVYDEDIYATYANLFYSKGEWEANIGLRYEYSQAIGFSETLDSTTNLSIPKFFPSVSISTPFIGPLGAALSYSYRIERPSYFDLNPFQYFLDPLTFSRGNPFLVPEFTHSGQFSLTYEKQPFFNLSYDYTTDVLTEVIEQNDETGEAFQTDVNLDKYIKYGGSLFFPLDFIAKPISGYAGVMVFYHDYQAEYLGAQFLQNQWSTTGYMQLNVNLPRDYKLEITGWLQGKGLDGIIKYETFYGVDAGIQKKFFDNKLNVQLSADGIIQKFFHGKVDYTNLNYNIVSSWEAPSIQAKITYNFGNQSLKAREKREASSASERQRAQDN